MNNPQINPDDPKWTAYVLGELDESERLEIEQLLETSEEARALVDDLKLATAMMKEELADVNALAMLPEQKATIHAAVKPTPSRWFGVMPATWGWGLAATAAVAVLAVTPVLVMRQDNGIAPLPGVRSGGSVAVNQQATVEEQPTDTAAPRPTYADKRSDDARLKEIASAERYAEQEAPSAKPMAGPPPPGGPPQPGAVFGGILGGQVDNPTLTGASSTAVKKDEAFVIPPPAPTAPAPVAAPVAAPPPPPPPPAMQQAAQNFLPGPGQRGGGGGGGRGAAAGRGGAAPAAGAAAPRSQTTDTITRDGLSLDNDAELRQYLQELAAARGAGDGQASIRVDGFANGQLQARQREEQGQALLKAATPPPAPPSAPINNRVNTPAPNTEAYDRIVDNPFIRTSQLNLPTFSIDVDTASYANVRRFLTQNQIPPRDAVRIEEMINYFNYDYQAPKGNVPIEPNMEVAAAPWNPNSRLVRIGIKAREINADRRPPSNLVFLIDVSGSMNDPRKLPLVKSGLKMLVERLNENDMVSMVVYAGASGLVLAPTSAASKDRINQAIDRLEAGGSTNGASGIQLAYSQADRNFIRNGTNRVILMTDGDFNVGITNQGELTRLIEQRAKSGVFLSVLGFGMGNIKDSTLEKLADQGNGNYAYIDSLAEARKVLVEQMEGTLVTVAKDVKIQVDFNPARVEAYRLIGYENRVLRVQDFNNDAKDAGDMGAGHTVTALFEVIPKGGNVPGPSIDPSKYVAQPAVPARVDGSASNEMLTLRVRYKQPTSDTSTKMDVALVDRGSSFSRASTDFRFAASVAEFGMILRESPYRGNATIDAVLDNAQGSRGSDRNGYRQEFIDLVQRAKRLGKN
jgi:Ca-activated chloride channel family protein